ncbi:MAG: MGMT family protein [Desulfurivibrionaceae bacterium]|nr:MGMT family protein [Desulfurivibrionaceae bacterium]
MNPLDFFAKTPAGSRQYRYSTGLAEIGFLQVRMIVHQSEIIHLSFDRIFHQRALAMLGRLIPAAIPMRMPAGIDHARILVRQLLSPELEGPAADFETNPFLKAGTAFQRKVWRRICRLGPGQTTTYGELAAVTGSPGGARAAGNACNRNPLPLIIPCHRVVAADGLGGFAGNLRIKRKLLDLEKKAGRGW